MKVVHLTEDNVRERIAALEALLPSLADQKKKRLRAYAQLAAYNKSLTDPALRKDPVQPKDKKKKKPRARKPRERKTRGRTDGKHLSAVCLACKEVGHLMKYCPTFKTSEKQCYKCGEADHSAKTCKAEGFEFAVCFYCGEKGHLAAYCEAKETKGIYVYGGCCHKCGSVWHLEKHCTENLLEKEDS
jgi:hypothetical protein